MERVISIPLFMSLLMDDLRKDPEDVQQHVLASLQTFYMDSRTLHRNAKIAGFSRTGVVWNLVSVFDSTGHVADLVEGLLRSYMAQLIPKAKLRAQHLLTNRELLENKELHPIRFLLQLFQGLKPTKNFRHLNLFIDGLRQVPHLSHFAAHMFITGPDGFTAHTTNTVYHITFLNALTKILRLPVPSSATKMVTAQDLFRVVIPDPHLRSRMTPLLNYRTLLVGLNVMQLLVVIIDRFLRLLQLLEARPGGLSLNLRTELTELLEQTLVHPREIRKFAWWVMEEDLSEDVINFLLSRHLVLVRYYSSVTNSYRDADMFTLLPSGVDSDGDYVAALQDMPPARQRLTLRLFLDKTPDLVLWAQADPTGRAPTGAAPKDAVYSPLRSLLAFAVAALRDAAAPDGAQVAELAVLLAVAVLVQVTPHEPSEARRREAYMWVLCLTEGHDEYCIPFLMGLVGRAMNSVRDQIFEAPEELPRDLLLTYAADLLRAIESDGAHPNYGALQDYVSRVTNATTDEALIARARKMEDSVAQSTASLKLREREPEAIGAGAAPESAEDEDGPEADPWAHLLARNRAKKWQANAADVVLCLDGKDSAKAGRFLMARAPALWAFLRPGSGGAAPAESEMLHQALSTPEGLRALRSALEEFCVGAEEAPPPETTALLKVVLSLVQYLFPMPGTRAEHADPAFDSILLPVLLACYGGTLGDCDVLLYTILHFPGGTHPHGLKVLVSHKYLIGPALANFKAVNYARPVTTVEELQAALLDECLDQKTLQRSAQGFPQFLPFTEIPTETKQQFRACMAEKYKWIDAPSWARMYLDPLQPSGSVEYLGKHRAEGGKIYDPRYALPMIYYLLHAMTEQNSVAKKGGGREHVLEISLNRWMHSGVLGYILRALGAVDHTLRELGYGCMTLFAALMKGSKHTQVRQCPCLKHPHEPLWRGVSLQVAHVFLEWFRNGIPRPFARLTGIHCAFIAKVLTLVVRAQHDPFRQICDFLLSHPTLDHSRIPMQLQIHAAESVAGPRGVAALKSFLIQCWTGGIMPKSGDSELIKRYALHESLIAEFFSCNVGVYDTSSNAYIEHAPVRNAILAFFKRLLSLEDDGMFLVYDVQISNFLCDVVQNAYPSKTPAEVTLAFENLALVFRLITSCFAVPKHRELRARYRHELTSTAAEGLIAVLHVRDLVPQTLAVLELAYECYLVTTYQWPKAAAYGGNGTVKQRWAGEELMALRRLNAPLIGPVLLEKMVGCVGAAAAEEWGDLRHRLRAILEMARRDHSAFRESRDGPLERINGLIAQCERATPPASGGAEGPERGRGVGAAAGGRTGDVGEARRESPAAGASEAGAGGADGGRRERGGSEGEPPRKRAKGARGTPQPREAEQEKVAA